MGTPEQPITSEPIRPIGAAGSAPNPVWPIVTAVAVVALAALGAVAVIAVRGGAASTPIVVSIFGFAVTLAGMLLALIKVQQVGQQVQAIHVDVNSRLTQMTEAIGAQKLAEGKALGAAQQRQQAADELLARAAAAALVAATPAPGPTPIVVQVTPGERPQ